MNESPFISFDDAAKLLNLHHTTIRQRKAGTEMLTHCNQGRRKFLLREEVETLAYKVIREAREQDEERKTLLPLG